MTYPPPPPPAVQSLIDDLESAGCRVASDSYSTLAACYVSLGVRHDQLRGSVRLYGHGRTWAEAVAMAADEWRRKGVV